MFDIGWQELALTAVVALVVLGLEELPGLMRTAGTLVRRAKLIAHDFRMNLEDMADQIEIDDYKKQAMARASEIEPPTVTADGKPLAPAAPAALTEAPKDSEPANPPANSPANSKEGA